MVPGTDDPAGSTGAVVGRFAPSPSGHLHVGNLRTAVVAWAMARRSSGGFVVRVEDLDPVTSRTDLAAAQLADLRTIGVDWDLPVVLQSERRALHRAAVRRLCEEGRAYPCYCTRREIRVASVAPHDDGLPDGAYPGTCRTLSARQRIERERSGRPPAVRLRADGVQVTIHDLLAGAYSGTCDDVVLQRNDGVPAYNLAVVLDDADQGVTQVVRGADLLATTPRQVLLQRVLGLPTPEYAHVPLVVGPDGERLAKRHGAVTLGELAARGVGAADVREWIAAGLGCDAAAARGGLEALLMTFDPARIPRGAVTFEVPSPAM